MKGFAGFIAKQPLFANAVGAAIGLAAVHFAPLKDESIQNSLSGLIVAAFLYLTHQTVVSPATHGTAVAVAARRPIETAANLDTGPPDVFPIALESTVRVVALDVAAKTGGLAGRLAHDAAAKVFEKGTSVVGKRFGKMFGK